MTDEEFLRALESCTLTESDFGHHAHIRAGYLYLRQSDFAGALDRMRRSIRNYATHHGKPDRYHETITVAYLALIQQCIFERGDGGGWATFARCNSELFNPAVTWQLLRPRSACIKDGSHSLPATSFDPLSERRIGQYR